MTPTVTARLRRALAATTVLVATVVGSWGVGAASASAEAGTEADALAAVRTIDPATYEAKVLRLINQRRAAHGLTAVREHRCTDRYAEHWGTFLAGNLAFYHQDLAPFFDDCGASYAGETLARGAVGPRRIVSMWLHSEGHRAILLSRHPNRIGLGATLDSRGDWVVAADFTRL